MSPPQLRGAFLQVGIGLAAGVILALVAGRLMSSLLFEVKSYNPVALCGAGVFLAISALIAALLPARRAAALDPMQALRVE